MTAVLQSPGNRVRGFLGPGHVCTVMGYREYEPIAAHYRVPIVITGFEPLDLLDGVLRAVRRLEAGEAGGGDPEPAGGRARGEPPPPRRRLAGSQCGRPVGGRRPV